MWAGRCWLPRGGCEEAGSETPQLDSAVLMAPRAGREQGVALCPSHRRLTEAEIARYETLVRRRMCHEPVAYLVGLQVVLRPRYHRGPRVLIPRPETELLVERVLAHVRHLRVQGQRRGWPISARAAAPSRWRWPSTAPS